MIIFLDFDGVLHGIGQPPFAQLPRLEGILRDHPQFKVVLTTSWREAYRFEKLRELFSADIQDRVIGQTPIINDPYTLADYRMHHRYKEVTLYFERAQIVGCPWVALEDDRRNFPEDLTNVVWCSDTTGLDDESEARLRRILSDFKETEESSTR